MAKRERKYRELKQLYDKLDRRYKQVTMDRDQMRMKLWCDVYVAWVNKKVIPMSDYESFANNAVAHFDAKFPEPAIVPFHRGDHGPPEETD